MQQMRPLGMNHDSAKYLLMTDQQYGTPADSYFAYINKRKKDYDTTEAELMREKMIIEELGLKNRLPNYYNVDKNTFEIQSSQEEIMKELKEVDPNAELDPIEIERINALRQKNIDKLIEEKVREVEEEEKKQRG